MFSFPLLDRVVLTNLIFKPSVLDALNLPVKFVASHISM